MKSKNVNNASKRTKKKIKDVFAEMLAEKREFCKMSVSELCLRAKISRGAFYSHYDDIYAVAEDYENELLDKFNELINGLQTVNQEQFFDMFFDFLRENDKNYKFLCKSNDATFLARKFSMIVGDKLLKICMENTQIKEKKYIALDINIFIEGLVCEYIRYCKGLSDITLDDLYDYIKMWGANFTKARLGITDDAKNQK